MKRFGNIGWSPIAVLLLFFMVWEGLASLFEIPAWLLPAPTAIFKEAFTNYQLFLPDVGSTVMLAASGLLLGASIGFIIATVLHLVPPLRMALYPFLIISQNVPIIVLAPLLVIWFGFGYLPKLIIITLVCFFPITIALLDGFRNAPRELVHYMKMSGATSFQLFSKVQFPNALPPLFSGLKISATYSVMGAVISEWLGAEKGIGVFMTLSSSAFRTDRVFIAIFIIVILSMLLYSLITLLEKTVIKWAREGDQ
ncbi:ABC transporter permease [Neobacillus piezotolerans]|uniref:ABC transporter permease n=1 Tax=Neobacillus piezotolerans TaxID=2259171 RepID=A0A3D8GV36_9BACI|nr:ABC transporter permease [Neobacillus piezotolerans]RDU38021.1 ABC transporter permease [Neobacillus piezotolerans]